MWVLTAVLIPYDNSPANRHLPENCCMTGRVSKSPAERRGVEKGGEEMMESACVCARVHGASAFFGRWEAGGKEKGKISL